MDLAVTDQPAPGRSVAEPWTSGAGEARVLAVGSWLGLITDPALRGDRSVGVVRSGGLHFTLGHAATVVWIGATAAPTQSSLAAAASTMREGRGSELIDWLFLNRLVVRLENEAGAAEAMLAVHTLLPLGSGHGNSRERPSSFVIADADGGSPVRVDRVLYSVWGASGSRLPLLECCAQVARALSLDPGDVAQAVVLGLPHLLASRAAFLDRL